MLKSITDQFRSIVQRIKGGETKYLINNVTVKPVQRMSQDIQQWRLAIQQAEGFSQHRGKLLDLYEDILLDGYLRAVKQKRIDQVTNRPIVFVKPDGTIVQDVTDLAKKSYFEELLVHVLDSKFYGHSLIEVLWPSAGAPAKDAMTTLIPRKHVKPRWGIVTENAFDLQGVDYRKPPFDRQTIEVGKPEELGLLMSVAQYVIYKRGNFGDWAEFNEVFGMPFRWATYNNEQSRGVLEAALEQAGPAGYVIAPEDAKMQFLSGNASGGGADVFRFLRQACNEEIGLAVLANTMTTTEARSSGYAQSKTHKEGEDELMQADRRFVCRVLNEKLTPILERLGYPVQEGSWEYQDEDAISLIQRVDMDIKISSQVPIEPSYWYETYGIPKPKDSELPDDEPEEADDEPDDEPDDADKEKKNLSLSARLDNYYHVGCSCQQCLQLADLPAANFRKLPANLENIVADNVYAGRYELNPELHRQYYSRFRKFARVGFARSLSDALDFADFELQQGLKRSISEFAALKQYNLIQELRAVAYKPVAEYKQAAKRIMARYNNTYLNAELITFETAAHSAGQWRDFIDRADLYPNLQFSTVGDDRVRDAHRALDGATYPVGDPFWDTHTPPLDWRCRCVLIQTDATEVSRASATIRKGFGANPYKTKRIINTNHPYYTTLGTGLDDLIQQAETLRADIERADVLSRARIQLPTLDGKAVKVNTANVMDQESAYTAIRNSMLAVLELIMSELRAAGTVDEVVLYDVTVLGVDFQLTFVPDVDTWILTKIAAK